MIVYNFRATSFGNSLEIQIKLKPNKLNQHEKFVHSKIT